MHQDIKTFEDDHCLVIATQERGCRLSIKVDIKSQSAQKSYLKAVKIVNKQISIPGFRKGHAPNQAVIGRYSSYVDQEWRETLVQEAYESALRLTQVYPLNRESISKPKLERYSQEEGATISFSYEHYPVVPEVDFSKLSIPTIEKQPVLIERIEETIEEIRRTHADWEDIVGRSVEEGDFVDITIDSLEEETPKPIVKDRRFEINDEHLSPWLKKMLIGLELEKSVEGVTEVDPKADDTISKNFKSIPVRITLHAIKKILLPSVDDELAKKVGAISIEDLRHKIKENLEKESTEECLNKKLESIEHSLLENYPFDLPTSIVESMRQKQMAHHLENRQNETLSDEEMQREQHRIEREIDQNLRLHFLTRQIVKQGSISLSNEELNQEVVRYITQHPYLYHEERDENSIRDLVSRLKSDLIERKAKEYALAQLNVEVKMPIS